MSNVKKKVSKFKATVLVLLLLVLWPVDEKENKIFH